MGEYRVLIGGGSPQWRASLEAAFANNSVMEVAGSVDEPELLATATRVYPEVVLWMAEAVDPLPVVQELKLKCPFTLPVLMVPDPNKVNMLELLRSGVRGCVPLRLLPRQIIHSLELIVTAGMVCLPRLGPEFFGIPRNGAETTLVGSLTSRERQVLSLLGKNLSNQEIAQALFLSESTIKTHLRSIFRKLGVKNRTQAVALALSL